VKATFFKLDGGSAQAGNIVTIGSEGGHTLEFWSVDNADNVEVSKTVHVKIDKLSPTITHTLAPPATTNGWYKDDVIVSFTCADSLSGVDSCPAAKTLGEGASQSASGTAVDAAGNSASASLTGINVDKTAPTLSGAPTTPPNADGWYNGNVSIH